MKNRNYFFIFILTCCSGIICTAEGQNKNRHYVKNRIMTTDDGNSFREKVLYYDNFGKHTETVQVGASPQGKDLHFTFGYDILDRPVGESLPLPDGDLRAHPKAQREIPFPCAAYPDRDSKQSAGSRHLRISARQ